MRRPFAYVYDGEYSFPEAILFTDINIYIPRYSVARVARFWPASVALKTVSRVIQ